MSNIDFQNIALAVTALLLLASAILFLLTLRENRNEPRVKISVNKSVPDELTLPMQFDTENTKPGKWTMGAAAIDLAVTQPVQVMDPSYGVPLVDTGVHVAIPSGYVGLVVARSSLCKRGMALANGVGVIDPDYRGSIKLTLVSIDGRAHNVRMGERVAQLLVVPAPNPVIDTRKKLEPTARGAGGFGSTGV